jgi:hypothetical protein
MTAIIDEEIQAAELARTEALKRQDVTGLGRILAPEFTYIHASGRSEDKDAYLEAIGSGAFRWTDFVHEGTLVPARIDRCGIDVRLSACFQTPGG